MTIYEVTQAQTVLGNPDVAALIGDRLWPVRLPTEPVMPCVTYLLISSPRETTQTSPGPARPRYRWDCWAKTYDEAVAVAIAVMKSLGQGRWVADEADHAEQLTGLFRRRVETMGWIDAPETP